MHVTDILNLLIEILPCITFNSRADFEDFSQHFIMQLIFVFGFGFVFGGFFGFFLFCFFFFLVITFSEN